MNVLRTNRTVCRVSFDSRIALTLPLYLNSGQLSTGETSWQHVVLVTEVSGEVACMGLDQRHGRSWAKLSSNLIQKLPLKAPYLAIQPRKQGCGRGARPARNRMCDGPPRQSRMLTGHFLLRRVTWWGSEHWALGDRGLPWNTWFYRCIYLHVCVCVYFFLLRFHTSLTWMVVWRKAVWIRMYEQCMWEMPGSWRKKGFQRGSGQLEQTHRKSWNSTVQTRGSRNTDYSHDGAWRLFIPPHSLSRWGNQCPETLKRKNLVLLAVQGQQIRPKFIHLPKSPSDRFQGI